MNTEPAYSTFQHIDAVRTLLISAVPAFDLFTSQVMSKIPQDEQCTCSDHNAANPATSFVQGLFAGSGGNKAANNAKPVVSDGKADL